MRNLHIKQILNYIFISTPEIEYPKSRIVKMIYLIDWKHCLEYGDQTTNIDWYFHHYGPYEESVIDDMRSDNDFEFNSYDYKDVIKLKGVENKRLPFVNDQLKFVVDFIINITKDLGYKEFIKLVYSTYPVINGEQYTYLDLPKLAIEYKREYYF